MKIKAQVHKIAKNTRIFFSRNKKAVLISAFVLVVAAGALGSAGFGFEYSANSALNNVNWTANAGAGVMVPACGSASNSAPTCSGLSSSVTISWTWATNASHTRECNLVNVGIYKSGVQVQGYQRTCNDSVTWTGGEPGTLYTYNVYFLDVDGNPAIETRSGSFTTTNCATPLSISSCSASPLTANIGEDVTWRVITSGGTPSLNLKQEWSNPTVSQAGWSEISPPSNDNAMVIARRFRSSEDYTLRRVGLYFRRGPFLAGVPLWVTLETDAADRPSGAVLPNGVSIPNFEASDSWAYFDFNNVELTAGTNYWIVLHGVCSGCGEFHILPFDASPSEDTSPGALSIYYPSSGDVWNPVWAVSPSNFVYRTYEATNNFTYSWHGHIPLDGKTGNPVVVQYSSNGPKSGSVDVSDGVSTVSASCGMVTIGPSGSSVVSIRRLGYNTTDSAWRTADAPAGTQSQLDALPLSSANPADFTVSAGAHEARVTELSGYTVTAGYCDASSGPCTVTSFSNATCAAGFCSLPVSVSSDTQVDFRYTAAGSHLECISSSCTSVPGAGSDECSPVGSACGVPATHLECVSGSCTVVGGAGPNTCSPAGSACGAGGPTHLECISNSCVSVSGSGANTCSPAGCTCSSPDISVSPGVIASGGSATLTWSAPGATSCVASASPVTPQWQGPVVPSGSKPVSPSQSTTYTITCNTTCNTGTDSAMLSVGIIEEPEP